MVERNATGARLLVVDDNRVNRLLLLRTLELQGHTAASAENGRVALEMMRREPYDVVLLDIAMPEFDGFAVLEQMVSDPALRDLPVIVTSALEGLDNVVRCIELGAEDYLQKPVSPVLLKARLSASLEKKRLRDQQKAFLQRFATREVAKDLASSGLAFGGKRVNASVLFCDIRGFTAIAEAQPPEDSIELLNTWYTLMFDAVGNHSGIVSVIMGDGLMAIFGAPASLSDHEAQAVHAALEMIETIELWNADRAAAGKPALRIGIGIASGDMVAGYAGTNERVIYTCIGDVVNLAARLESHTKIAQHAILIDAATREALAERVPVEPLGAVKLQGKTTPVQVFAVAPLTLS